MRAARIGPGLRATKTAHNTVTKKKIGKAMADTATAPAAELGATTAQLAPVVVKKYANRSLYNTAKVELRHPGGPRHDGRRGRDFAVYNEKTGEDMTRSVLTQIIVEEEARARTCCRRASSASFISFYGDSMHSWCPATSNRPCRVRA